MKLEILAVYENLVEYIAEIEKGNTDIAALWDKYAIEPYWQKISQWAPFDMSDRKPKPIKNIAKLKQQIEELRKLDLNKLEEKLMEVVKALPNYDDDHIVIALYPLDDDNLIVKEKQNGVWGACIFGNILININPLAEDYLDWIPFVFAHEYHHCVFGNYWYVIKGGCAETLLQSMLGDGQADSFAKSFNPSLNPKWLSQVSEEEEKELWHKHYANLLGETDIDYDKYMFGDKEAQIPWCAGYYFGYNIVESFKKSNPEVGGLELIEMSVEDIYSKSNYGLHMLEK